MEKRFGILSEDILKLPIKCRSGTFNSVDAVGHQRYVFNIKGNDFRLVVLIQFTPKTVYIRFVGSHKEYDAIKDIKNI